MRTLTALAFAALATACPTAVNVAEPDACADDRAGCIPCTFDTDCPNDGVCTEGVCGPGTGLPSGGPGPDGEGCSQTSECPMNEMCNGATQECNALPDGWCRQESDCSGGT